MNALRILVASSALCTLAPGIAWSTDWELSADMRLVGSDGQPSLFDGGLGALRYDSEHEGLQVGRLRAALTEPLGDVWALKVDASYFGQDDAHPVGVTEAYLEYRPYPLDGWRTRVRIGAFIPPVSLEDTASGWTSPYTLSNSALNSWIGEEVRTIGIEGQLEWLGTRLGHDFDLGLTGAIFGWNEPAGTVVSTGGFSLNDFQTMLPQGYVGGHSSLVFPEQSMFHEIDGHEGFYVGAQARYLDRVTLLALHYDNRANPSAEDIAGNEAYDTQFNSAGVRVDTDVGWTAIIQWLAGTTTNGPLGDTHSWPFHARFALVSRQWGRQAVSARYDVFGITSTDEDDFGAEQGHAWTVAYIFNQGPHWRFALEWLHVTSEAVDRATLLDEPTLARENQTQFSIRYTIGSGL